MTDMAAFEKLFNANYSGLYDGLIRPKKDYVALGDQLINAHDPVVAAFNQYRQDILMSDREVAAFAMTYEKMVGMIA